MSASVKNRRCAMCQCMGDATEVADVPGEARMLCEECATGEGLTIQRSSDRRLGLVRCESRHTPGPWYTWSISPTDLVVTDRPNPNYAREARVVCVMGNAVAAHRPPAGEIEWANARLIAAAPALLAACENAALLCEQIMAETAECEGVHVAARMLLDGSEVDGVPSLRAAIAQAVQR